MSIRDIVIVGIVLVLAAMAIRRPWIGVMNWTWLSIMNPHRYAWGFAYSAPVAAIAAASTLIGLLFTQEKRSPFQGAPIVWLFIFTIWLNLSWLLGYDPAGDYEQWAKVMKIYLMTFVALSVLQTKHHIMAFVWVTIASLAVLAAKGGLFTVLTAGSYRVWGPEGTFIADNNTFALAVIVCIPMIRFLQLQLEPGWKRHLMSLVMLLSTISAVGSYSRGALLALAAMGAMFWWRNSQKALIGVAILIGIILMLPMMPDQWWARMDTIQDYKQDGSAMGRINAWLVAIEVAKNNFFGGGMSYQHPVYFTMYGTSETIVRAAHSIYFQILGNHGFVGLFLYLMILTTTYKTAGNLRRKARTDDASKWAAELGAMIQVSLVAFAVGGAFLSLPYFDLPYNLMVMAVIAHKWVENRDWETEADVSFLEFAGLKKRAGK